jgi:ubiquinone/menaquinone biosynthesis C-methylase UbiE
MRDNVLEISGNTREWLKYFKFHTIANFPEVDAHDLPYKDESFDAVLCNQVLEHVKNPWVCVKEFHRVLKGGGILILSSPFIYQEHNHPVDNWRFTISGLRILCEDFSEVLLTCKGGNSKMVKHIVENPSDRDSKKFQSLLKYEDNQKYYITSTIIVRK